MINSEPGKAATEKAYWFSLVGPFLKAAAGTLIEKSLFLTVFQVADSPIRARKPVWKLLTVGFVVLAGSIGGEGRLVVAGWALRCRWLAVRSASSND